MYLSPVTKICETRQNEVFSVTLFGFLCLSSDRSAKAFRKQTVLKFLFPHPPSLFLFPSPFHGTGGFQVQSSGHKGIYYGPDLNVLIFGLADPAILSSMAPSSSRYISSHNLIAPAVDLGPTARIGSGNQGEQPFQFLFGAFKNPCIDA